MARALWASASAVKRPRVRMKQLLERPAMVTRLPGALAPLSEAMGHRKLPSTPPVRMRVHAALRLPRRLAGALQVSFHTAGEGAMCRASALPYARLAAAGASKTWFGDFVALAISGHYSQATQAWTFRLELRSSSAVPLSLTPQVRLFPPTRALSPNSLPPSVLSSLAPSLSLPPSLHPLFSDYAPPPAFPGTAKEFSGDSSHSEVSQVRSNLLRPPFDTHSFCPSI